MLVLGRLWWFALRQLSWAYAARRQVRSSPIAHRERIREAALQQRCRVNAGSVLSSELACRCRSFGQHGADTEFLWWAILGAMPEPGDVPQPPAKRVKHEIVNGWCLTCRRAKCHMLPNPAAVPLPGLPAAWTPRERQEWIDRARAAQPIVQANFRARLQALRARKNLPEDRLPMAPALNGLN